MKKTPLLLLSVASFCILVSSCQKSDLSENKNFLRNQASAENDSKGAKKKNLAIGDYYGGGIVFYIDQSGKHGLIVAMQDLGLAPWGCFGTVVPGTTQVDGSGLANTRLMLAFCGEAGTAARLCNDLVIREKGDNGKKYDDWFLPSVNELGRITAAVSSSVDPKLKSLLADESYWTSNQWDFPFQAIPQDPSRRAVALNIVSFQTPTDIEFVVMQFPFDKNIRLRVIPIRAF